MVHSVSHQRPIGVFDSGVGGLSVWQEIVRCLPHEDTIYLADQAHVPYGSRSLADVRGFCEAITSFLLAQGARIVGVACNTASAAALRPLRSSFASIPFVGMEPAVKPAVERSQSGVVAVIATSATFQGELFASLLERYAHDVEVLTQVCPGLVEAVEAGALGDPSTEILLRRCLAPLLDAGIDQLVLGCTHYPFLRPMIERVVGKGISIIDPAPAVARQTARVLEEADSRAGRDSVGRHTFFTTGDVSRFKEMVDRLVGRPSRGREVRAARWQGTTLKAQQEPC